MKLFILGAALFFSALAFAWNPEDDGHSRYYFKERDLLEAQMRYCVPKCAEWGAAIQRGRDGDVEGYLEANRLYNDMANNCILVFQIDHDWCQL